jgi:hypothetical protein
MSLLTQDGPHTTGDVAEDVEEQLLLTVTAHLF